jgi:hypothetical protein
MIVQLSPCNAVRILSCAARQHEQGRGALGHRRQHDQADLQRLVEREQPGNPEGEQRHQDEIRQQRQDHQVGVFLRLEDLRHGQAQTRPQHAADDEQQAGQCSNGREERFD